MSVTAARSPASPYAADYQGMLADHLPMTLSALRRMGADDERRETFARRYVLEKELRPLERGDRELQSRAAVRARLLAEGRDAVLRADIATLGRGLGARAFHAFIRVAYAIIDESEDDLAAGLAYWRDTALDLGEPRASSQGAEPIDVVAGFARAREVLAHVPATLDPRALIADRMVAVSRDPLFDDVAGTPTFDSDAVARLAAATVRIFAATRNFTLLHAMTATHALRIVLPYAPDRAALLGSFWRAIVAAYVSAGAPAFPDEISFAADIARAPSWEIVRDVACASRDEHVIKAVFTAWSEDLVYRDPLYRVAAARYLGIDG